MDGIELLSACFKTFEFSKHWHDELAIGLILKGAEGLEYKGSTIFIPEGHIVAINPSEIHTGFAGSEIGWEYRMFYFDTDLVSEVLSEVKPDIPPFIKSPIIDDKDTFRLLYKLHISLELSSLSLSRETLLTLALVQLFLRHGDHKPVEVAAYSEARTAKVVRDYLINHWQENVTLQCLSELVDRSKFQIIRSFTRLYGLTPHQFLLLLKVNKAKHLIQSGYACADAAMQCGFFDQSHMSRNFKRVVGVSPSRFIVNFCG